MTTLARIAVLLAAMAAAAPALAQPYLFEGRWAQRPQYCGNRWGPIDVPDQVPITVSARRLRGPLIDCRFRSVTAVSATRWRIVATCSGEGERNRETFDLSMAGGRLVWHWGSQPPSYVRCSAG